MPPLRRWDRVLGTLLGRLCGAPEFQPCYVGYAHHYPKAQSVSGFEHLVAAVAYAILTNYLSTYPFSAKSLDSSGKFLWFLLSGPSCADT